MLYTRKPNLFTFFTGGLLALSLKYGFSKLYFEAKCLIFSALDRKQYCNGRQVYR